ncbi:sulfur carrier protein ThiS [Nocardioides sp. BGMRC 2183]|nr:sulfur carrier protein ThiS [Nocardioides sp. BGMRC 2183]
MITINGRAREWAGGASVADLLRQLELGAEPRGLAVAVDGAVVPRAEWSSHQVRDGAAVEVVTAVQGG